MRMIWLSFLHKKCSQTVHLHVARFELFAHTSKLCSELLHAHRRVHVRRSCSRHWRRRSTQFSTERILFDSRQRRRGCGVQCLSQLVHVLRSHEHRRAFVFFVFRLECRDAVSFRERSLFIFSRQAFCQGPGISFVGGCRESHRERVGVLFFKSRDNSSRVMSRRLLGREADWRRRRN